MHNYIRLCPQKETIRPFVVGPCRQYKSSYEWHTGTRGWLLCSIATFKSTTTSTQHYQAYSGHQYMSTVWKNCKIQLLIISLSSLQKEDCEASNIYELMLECWFLAFVISSSFISLRLPVFATPPVTLAATTSLRYPRAPTLVL